MESPETLSLVITDVHISGYVDGAMFANVVAAYRPDVPIVVMSGYSEPEEGALPPGTMFLAKPFTSSELLRLVGQVLDR